MGSAGERTVHPLYQQAGSPSLVAKLRVLHGKQETRNRAAWAAAARVTCLSKRQAVRSPLTPALPTNASASLQAQFRLCETQKTYFEISDPLYMHRGDDRRTATFQTLGECAHHSLANLERPLLVQTAAAVRWELASFPASFPVGLYRYLFNVENTLCPCRVEMTRYLIF